MEPSSDSSPSNSKQSPPSDGNKDSGGNNDGNTKSGGNGNSGGNNGNKSNDQNKNNDQNSDGDGSSGGNNGNNNNNDQNNNDKNDNNNNNNSSNNNGNDNNNGNNNNGNNNNGNNNNQNNDQNKNNNNQNNDQNKNNNQNNNGGNNNQNNNGRNNNQNNNGGNNWHAPPPPKSPNNNRLAPPPPLRQKKSPLSPAVPDKDSKSSSNTPSTPIIVGLASGAGLLFVMLLLFFACSRKKKRRQSSHLMDNSDPYRPNDYWQSGGMYKSNEHVLSMAPPPAAYSGWNNAGTHHPPMISSEMNSTNFSGPHGPLQPPPHPSVALGYNTSTFAYDDLAVATSGFSHAKLLGQGGFGFVHKGVLPNGKEIAVKSLKAGSGQGDREFAAEVEIISRVHHRHLVSLVGYCLNGERKLLVYEFVPNNTLEFHLYNKNRPPLDWASRVKIALGSAKGLAYLHEDCHPKIIHRDIKAANILIDDHFEAKVADFGLAKLNQENVTHVSTRVMGTFGYLAPEYASSGKLTEKSDVFSFGVMLLELITGRRPVDTTGDFEEDTLVDWARPLLTKAIEDRDYFELADRRLENKYDHEGMARMVACASTSIRHSAKKRPKMSQIVRVLEGDVSLEDLHEGIKPSPSGLFGGSNTSSEFDSDSYNANMKNFRKAPLGGSHDYPSSDYGNTSNSEEMVKKL